MNTLNFPLSLEDSATLLKILYIGISYEEKQALQRIRSENYMLYYKNIVKERKTSMINNSHRRIAELSAQLVTTTRQSTEETLKQKYSTQSTSSIEEAICLSAQLLTMVPIERSFATGEPITISYQTKFVWKAEHTIKDLLMKEFVPQVTMKEHGKLGKIFNARNFERIAKIEVRWTNNLADHLRMRDDDKAVELFHCASLLALRKRSDKVFPQGFIQETMETLSLLLPEHDKDVERWFNKQLSRNQKRIALDPLARECGQLKGQDRQIDHFIFWHDRIVVLKQTFDEAEPKSMEQWWRDRRRRVQWYTFWVAVLVLALTIFFGLVQSIEGGLQVWLAYRNSN